MILTRSLPELTLALTYTNSFGGTLLSVTVCAQRLKVTPAMVIACNDVVYFCGLRATALTDEPVTVQDSLPETIPVTRESSLAVRSLPLTRIFQGSSVRLTDVSQAGRQEYNSPVQASL